MPFTYILRCADETLYVGRTQDLASRQQTHNDGHGANYTATRRPVRMVYAEEHASVASAIAREHQLKRWSRNKKEALILGDRAVLRSLGRKPAKSMAVFTWRDLLNLSSAFPVLRTPPAQQPALRLLSGAPRSRRRLVTLT